MLGMTERKPKRNILGNVDFARLQGLIHGVLRDRRLAWRHSSGDIQVRLRLRTGRSLGVQCAPRSTAAREHRLSAETRRPSVKIANPVKDKLKQGGVVLGVFISMPSPEVVEILSLGGFDFIFLDGEHGRISPDSAYEMILACEANGVQAMARVGQNDKQVILKYLDLGVSGVMIPQTTTIDDAKRALDAMRYYPRGGRGLAGGRTFGYGTMGAMSDLVPQINDRIVSMIQFEHIDSLPHLEAMLALPELDVLFVGPTDLAQSMGHAGHPEHPDVVKVIQRVCDAAKGSGKVLGTVANGVEANKQKIDQGFQMIVSNVPGLLMQSTRELTNAIKR